MRSTRIIMILMVGVGLYGLVWGEARQIERKQQLVRRDGLMYEVSSDKPFTGQSVGYFPNGQKAYENNFLNGLPHGKWCSWYNNGQKVREEEYVKGERNGKYIEWHKNGQKRVEGTYCNDHQCGKWFSWYENGAKEQEKEFVDGKAINFKYWSKEGKPYLVPKEYIVPN